MRLYVALYTSALLKDTPLARGEEGYIQLLKLEAPSPSVTFISLSLSLSFLPFFFVHPSSVLFVHRAIPDFSIVREYQRSGARESCPRPLLVKGRDEILVGKRPPVFRLPLLFHFSFAFLLAKENEDRYRQAQNHSALGSSPRVFSTRQRLRKFVAPLLRVARRKKTVSNIEITSITTRAFLLFVGSENPRSPPPSSIE